MLRQRIPKETDFTRITKDNTLQVKRWVNEYPRGILNGRYAVRILLGFAKEAGIEGFELFLQIMHKKEV